MASGDTSWWGATPRFQAYLDQLPIGLASFPDCRARAAIHRTVYEFAAQPLEDLPEPLQELVHRPPAPSTWLPQCHTLALIVAMVEARRLPPPEEAVWIRQAASHLFASPMYDILMRAASPRMVFKSANIRWGAFFSGTSLTSLVQQTSAVVHLNAPPGLFNEDLARIFADVIHAAVNHTRDASEIASVELAHCGIDGIEYIGRW